MDHEEEIAKLPHELQTHLHDKVLQLRKPLHVLSDELKSDIETYPLFSQIERGYAQVFSSEVASSWMENALINLLNDNRGLDLPLNESLRSMFPKSTEEEIRTILSTGSHLHRLWIITPSRLRCKMRDISSNMLLHYISHG